MIRAYLIAVLAAILFACQGGNRPELDTGLAAAAPENGMTVAVCSRNPYGTAEQRRAIQIAMFAEDPAAVRAAIDAAKATRGAEVGCPEANYGPRAKYPTRLPDLADIGSAWQAYAARLPAEDLSCPRTGRDLAPIALSALRLAEIGYADERDTIRSIADHYVDQQFTYTRIGRTLAVEEGLYGYYFEGLPARCDLEGIAGEATRGLCAIAPGLCVVYRDGAFAGSRFAIKDHQQRSGPTDLVGDIGGAAFDAAWTTLFILEAAITDPDSRRRQKYADSAKLAGEWALAQPLVTNHNYTAKNAWSLAALYGWTGRGDFRERLRLILDANLVPGILSDGPPADGIVDGTDIEFRALDSGNARRPGRTWDAHNALPWYHAMNAAGLVEAYVAFRDRGDVADAARYRPYALLAIDNLAAEIVNLGAPLARAPGYLDMPHALLTAIWKICRHEGLACATWEQAAGRLWNSGRFSGPPGSHGAAIGLYALVASSTPYRPYAERGLP